jgi:predicted outer membrane protein
MRRFSSATSLVLLLSLAACSQPGDEASRTAPATSPEPRTASIPGQTGEPTRDPAQIAGVVAAISDTEIAISQIIIDRNIEGPLRDFAQQLQAAHRKIQEKAVALNASKAGERVALQQGKAKTEIESLSQEQDDQALMNAYIAAVVRDHGDALKQLDAELIPAAEGELKTFLEDARKQIAAQLEEAQALASARY